MRIFFEISVFVGLALTFFIFYKVKEFLHIKKFTKKVNYRKRSIGITQSRINMNRGKDAV